MGYSEQASLQRRKDLKGMKEQTIQISMRRTFQAKKTSTKATKQYYAMLRINYDEKRDKLRGYCDSLGDK